jgi:hypothetical protein
MIEVKYVDALLNAIKGVQSDMDLISTITFNENGSVGADISFPREKYTPNTDTKLNILPTTTYDFYYFKNPYGFFTNRENINKANVFSMLGYRLTDRLLNKHCNFDAEVLGAAEAYNFYISVPQLNLDNQNQLAFKILLEDASNSDDKLNEIYNDFITYINLDNSSLNDENKEFLLTKFSAEKASHPKPIQKGSKLPINFNDLVDVEKNYSTDKYFPTENFKVCDLTVDSLVFFTNLFRLFETNLITTIDDFNSKYMTSVVKEKKYGTPDPSTSFFCENPQGVSLTNYYRENVHGLTVPTYPYRIYYDNLEVCGTVRLKYFTEKPEYRYDKLEPKVMKVGSYDQCGGMDPGDADGYGIMHYRINNTTQRNSVYRGLEEGLEGKVADPSNYTTASLYASELFYAQNEIEDEETRILSKAYLFLELCSTITPVNVNEYGARVSTKWGILCIGARLWRYYYDGEPIKNILITKNETFVVGENFYHFDIVNGYNGPALSMTPKPIKIKRNTKGDELREKFTINFDFFTKDSPNTLLFINMFKDWAINEFNAINNMLEMKH